MAHILILEQWKQRVLQIIGLSHQLEAYNGSNQSQADALLAEIETVWTDTLNATDVDDLATRIETFLEI